MASEGEIGKALINFVRDQVHGMDVRPVIGTVVEVDEQARICEVKPAEGAEVETNIQARQQEDSGLAVVPEVDSNVIVGFLSEDYAFVVSTSKVRKYMLDCDEVVFNGGQNEGLVVYPELKKELKTEKQRLSALISAIENAAVGSQDGGATFKSNIVAAMQAVQEGNFERSEITDDKVTH